MAKYWCGSAVDSVAALQHALLSVRRYVMPMETATKPMTGADAVIRTAVAAGIDVCFANPGTTELSLVEALDKCPEMRSVLAVFEGVCTGAADGYARISGKPGLALLHLGPGFANGIANLHNARKAKTPVISI